MSVRELEQAVSVLPPEELKKFRAWFSEFEQANWDRQLEEDSKAGRLDHLINKALDEHCTSTIEPSPCP
jgi:hypothetical protein